MLPSAELVWAIFSLVYRPLRGWKGAVSNSDSATCMNSQFQMTASLNRDEGTREPRRWTRRRALQTIGQALGLVLTAADPGKLLAGSSDSFLPNAQGNLSVEIVTRTIKIPALGATLPVYLARPAIARLCPAILIYSREAQLDERHRAQARRLAQEGYVTLTLAGVTDRRTGVSAARKFLDGHPAVRRGLARIVA